MENVLTAIGIGVIILLIILIIRILFGNHPDLWDI